MGTLRPRTEERAFTTEYQEPRLAGLSTRQWITLVIMGGAFLLTAVTLVLVLRSAAFESVDVVATAIAGPTPTSTPPLLVPDAVARPGGLYWPPHPQPLATPDAPSDLLWWDAQFAYRRPILLDAVASGAPARTWARLLLDGEKAQQEGKMRADGADLRVLAWDGMYWWEIPRWAQPCTEKRGWEVLFHLQDPEIARKGHYYLYYGNPLSEPPPVPEYVPDTSRLLLVAGAEEGVEWGPEITWTANSTTTQTLVSADGRIVIMRPPGGLEKDVRVRLRTVPAGQTNARKPLLGYELHVDPPPVPVGASQIVHWNPPLTVVLNCAGLRVNILDLQRWTHFAYDEERGAWYSVLAEFDRERGLVRIVTDQP